MKSCDSAEAQQPAEKRPETAPKNMNLGWKKKQRCFSKSTQVISQPPPCTALLCTQQPRSLGMQLWSCLWQRRTHPRDASWLLHTFQMLKTTLNSQRKREAGSLLERNKGPDQKHSISPSVLMLPRAFSALPFYCVPCIALKAKIPGWSSLLPWEHTLKCHKGICLPCQAEKPCEM